MFSFTSKSCSQNSIGNIDSYIGAGTTEGWCTSAAVSFLDEFRLKSAVTITNVPHNVIKSIKLVIDETVAIIVVNEVLLSCLDVGGSNSGSKKSLLDNYSYNYNIMHELGEVQLCINLSATIIHYCVENRFIAKP